MTTNSSNSPRPNADTAPEPGPLTRPSALSRLVQGALQHGRPRNVCVAALSRIARRMPSFLSLAGRTASMIPPGCADPVYVRLGTTDISVYEEMFVLGEYDAALNADLGAIATVVDLGANIGLSVRLWRRAFPGAQVIAVEPDRENLELARRNAACLDAHTSSPPVRFIRACATGSPRTVRLDRSNGAWGFRMADEPIAGEEIPGMPIAEILRETEAPEIIDLLKCDIEGAEREVFGSCADWIGRVRNLIVEIHAGYTQDALQSDLARAGYRAKMAILKDAGDTRVLLVQRAD